MYDLHCLKVQLLFVGKTTESYLKEGIEIYLKRLTNYIPVTVTVVQPSSAKELKKALDEEGKTLQSKLLPGDFIIVLDEKGVEIGSKKLSESMMKWMVQGVGRVVFITGGAFGISAELKVKASYILSFSKFTFTHQMVRLILVEQIYRAMTITRNESYHHD